MKMNRVIRALRDSIDYGYASNFMRMLRGPFPIKVLARVLRETYKDEAEPIVERMITRIGMGSYDDVAFYIPNLDRTSGTIRPVLVTMPVVVREKGRVSYNGRLVEVRFPPIELSSETDEADFLRAVDKKGIYTVELNDEVLTRLPYWYLVTAARTKGLVR